MFEINSVFSTFHSVVQIGINFITNGLLEGKCNYYPPTGSVYSVLALDSRTMVYPAVSYIKLAVGYKERLLPAINLV